MDGLKIASRGAGAVVAAGLFVAIGSGTALAAPDDSSTGSSASSGVKSVGTKSTHSGSNTQAGQRSKPAQSAGASTASTKSIVSAAVAEAPTLVRATTARVTRTPKSLVSNESSQSESTTSPAVVATQELPSAQVVATADPAPTIASVVHELLSVFGLTAAQTYPVVPSGDPASWSLLAWARREIGRVLSDGELSSSPVQIQQTVTSTVVGSVNITNPYNDAVGYQVATGPAKGTVVVNFDGIYTYTPSAALAAAGGVDTFTIAYHDNSFHLFGSPTKMVTVTVAVTGPQGAIINTNGTGAQSIVLSGNGKRGFVLNTDNRISVVDTDPTSTTYKTVIATIPFTKSITDADGVTGTIVPKVIALAADATGSTLYIASTDTPSGAGDHTLTVVTLTSGVVADGGPLITSSVVGSTDTGDAPTDLALSADGSRVYVLTTGTAGGSTVKVIDPTAIGTVGAILGSAAAGAGSNALAVDANGKVYVLNAGDGTDTGTVLVIDPANGNAVTTIKVGGSPRDIAFGTGATGAGSYAYVANYLSNSVSVIDTNAGSATYNQVIATITVGGEPSAIAVSADGKHVYVAQSYTNSVAIIDTATNTLTGRIDTTAGGTPTGIALSSDGTRAFVTNFLSDTITDLSITPTLTPVPPSTDPGLLGSTHGFQVYNLSSQPITLTKFLTDGKVQAGGPGVGTVIAPGSYVDFEVIVYGFKNNLVEPVFSVPTASAPIDVVLENVNTTRHIARCGSGGDQCAALGDYRVALMDPPGTVITLDANQNSQAQQIGQTLSDLCGSAMATCNFTATSELLTHDKLKQYGNGLENQTSNPIILKTTTTRTVTESIQDSVQIQIQNVEKAIFEKVTVQVQVKFQHTWTEAKTFSQEIDATVDPGYGVQIWTSDPIYRDYGNFTLKMGNTTWNLNNIYFDSARPGGTSTYVVTQTKLAD